MKLSNFQLVLLAVLLIYIPLSIQLNLKSLEAMKSIKSNSKIYERFQKIQSLRKNQNKSEANKSFKAFKNSLKRGGDLDQNTVGAFSDAINNVDLMMGKEPDNCIIGENVITKVYGDLLGSLKNKKDVIKQLGFLHGPCNPVIVVPGLFASKLEVIINCDEFKKDAEKKAELEFYCGTKEVCKDGDKQKKYNIWANVLGDGLYMKISSENVNNTCMGYFFKYFNKQSPCGGAAGCRNSDHIRFIPFNLTEKAADFNSGFNAVINLANLGILNKVNYQPGVTENYKGIYEALKKAGYQEGYSMAAMPYHFMEAFCENPDFDKTFRKVVEYIYDNFGGNKKIVLIGHSYGNLNIHYQLTTNKDLKDKIKHFISIAPPFGGAPKASMLVARGSTEFHEEMGIGKTLSIRGYKIDAGIKLVFDYTRFAMSLAFPYTPAGYKLNVFNSLKLLEANTDKKISDFTKKLRNSFKYDTCVTRNPSAAKDCLPKELAGKVTIPEEDFGESFAWLKDQSFCTGSKKDFDDKFSKEFGTLDTKDEGHSVRPLKEACKFKIFDYESCAFILQLDGENKTKKNNEGDLLNNLCRDTVTPNMYFLNDCSNPKKPCHIEYLKKHIIQPEQYTEEITKLCKKRVNVSNFNDCKAKIPSRLFSDFTREKITEDVQKVENMCGKYNKQRLDDPGVPITLIYNKSFETRAAYEMLGADKTDPQYRRNTYFSGGDSTVPLESALFPVLAWSQTNEKVKILDYCSPVANYSKYHFKSSDDIHVNKDLYKFLHCRCVTESGYYKKDMKGDCGHAEMLNDINVIQAVGAAIQDTSSAIKNNTKDDRAKLVALLDKNAADHNENIRKIFADVYLDKFPIKTSKKRLNKNRKFRGNTDQPPVVDNVEVSSPSDLTPEAIEAIQEAMKNNNLWDYPVQK